ncbi:MAG: helix-turn-helix domain-containing protein [Roseobacter sp.]
MSKSKRRSEGQYVPLPYSQLKSHAWRALSGAAVKLWLELHTRFNGSNNGRLTLSFAEAAKALGMGKATVQRAFSQLVDHGFLVLEKEGTWYSRRAHEWRLTTKSVDRVGRREIATHDWHNWRPPKTKRGSRSEPSASSVVPFENPKDVLGSKPEPVRPIFDRSVGSETEH